MIPPLIADNDDQITLDLDLMRKALRLKESAYFVGNTELGYMQDKQVIFLVLAGVKPLGEVVSAHMVEVSYGRKSVPDDPEAVGDFLELLGLKYKLFNEKYWTRAVIALEPGLVHKYVASTDEAVVGLSFGFPRTAVAAYVAGSCLEIDEQDKILKQAGIPVDIPMFGFSHEHWQEELKVVKRWYETLKAYGLVEPLLHEN